MLNTTKKPILLALLIVLGSIAGCIGNDEEETELETLTIAFEVKDDYTNVDENPQTPQKFGVRGIPTLMIFKEGKLIDSKIGSLPKTSLEAWIQSNL